MIQTTVANTLGETARIYVFGSRLQDDARGGDLDLLIEGETKLTLLQRARIKLTLEQHLGMPVDIIATQLSAPRTPFQSIAHRQGVRI
ncbi:MAG: nucleotidyltransferase domain-containing protein [Sulfuriferula sp.]